MTKTPQYSKKLQEMYYKKKKAKFKRKKYIIRKFIYKYKHLKNKNK